MQVVSYFKHHGNLSGERPGAANIFPRNSGFIEAIEHAEHSENTSVGAKQRHCKQLPSFIAGNDLLIGAGLLANVVRPENLFRAECARDNAFRKNMFNALRHATDHAVAYPELTIFV